MQEWWQNLPEQMNPIMLSVGPVQIYWYSMMYLVAFFIVYHLMMFRIRREEISLTKDQVTDFATWAVLGTILGGRLGYVFFYDFSYFIQNPIEIFWPFRDGVFTGLSGMSYHGGMIGVVVSTFLFSKRHYLKFLSFIDQIATATPIAYTFGRLGNFINGELYGRVTTSKLGMYFASAPEGGEDLRHPSQLYEGFFEGIILFAILWPLRNKMKNLPGSMLGLYLIFYGFFRFCIEYAREPDEHLGFVLLSFSMGQVLCFAMIIAGIIFVANGKRIQIKESKSIDQSE